MSTTLTDNQQIILAALNITGQKPSQPVRVRIDRSTFDGSDEEFAAAQERANQAYVTALADFDQQTIAYEQQLKLNAREIKTMLSPESGIGKQLGALSKALDKDAEGGKAFVGTIVKVGKEPRSTRGVIYLHTGTNREGKDPLNNNAPLEAGVEFVRTERTDDNDGAAMGRAAQLLLGHRVVVYVEMQTNPRSDNKVRVVVHLEDKGMDSRWDKANRTLRAE